jgi:autotransporter-associated beta strand protein
MTQQVIGRRDNRIGIVAASKLGGRRQRNRRRWSLAVSAAAAAVGMLGQLGGGGGGASSALAGTNGTWTNTTSGGLWSVGTNWSSGNIADGQDGIADFSTLDIAADDTVHLDTARIIGGIKFGDLTPSNNWIIDNNAVTTDVLTFSTSSGTPTISSTTATTLTISAGIAGTQGLAFTGVTGSQLTLSGGALNTLTGGLTITGGVLRDTLPASIPASNLITINGGGAMYTTTGGTLTIPNSFVLNSGTLHVGGSSIKTYSGGINLTGAGTILNDGGSTSILSGVISGGGGLTTNGATTQITGINTYSGGTTLASGTLNINSDAALGAVPVSPATNISFTAASTLQAGAPIVNLNANRNISIPSATAVTLDPAAGNMFIINGSIANTGTASTITHPTNSGVIVLAGSNNFVAGTILNFTGSTSTDSGSYRLTNSSALGSNNVTVNLSSNGNQGFCDLELAGGVNIANTGNVLTAVGKNEGNADLRNLFGNNTWAGSTYITNTGGQMNIESSDPNGTLTLGNISTGNSAVSARTILLYGNGNGVVNGVISNTNGSGTGIVGTVIVGGRAGTTWTFNNANTYNNGTAAVINASGGTAFVDYNAGGSFAATTDLTLAGGAFSMNGKTTGTTAQTFVGTFTVSAGGGSVVINPNGGTSTTLTLPNTWSRAAGGTVNFDLSAGTPTTAIVSTNPAVTNGIFGYGTVKDNTGIGFLTISSGAVARYTGATALPTSGTTSTTNYSVALAGTTQTQATASFAVNSLSIDAGSGGTLDLGGATDVMTLTSGGLLMTNAGGAGNFTIQNGQVGNNNQELIVQQYGTGTLTINGTISGGSGSLTKSGPGTLVLGVANNYTGATTITVGGAISEAGNNTGTATSTVALAGGTLAVTGTFSSAHPMTLSPAGGTIDVALGQTLTQSGTISSATQGRGGALTKNDTGTLFLSGTGNTYTGGTIINGGTLQIAGNGSLGGYYGSQPDTVGNADINIIFGGTSTLQTTANITLDTDRSVMINPGVTATIDPQANTLTMPGEIWSGTSSGGLNIGATGGSSSGLVTFGNRNQYTVPTTVVAGTLAVPNLANGGVVSSLGTSSNAAANLVINAGATLRYTGSASTSTDRNFTLGGSGSSTLDVSNAAAILTMSGATPVTSNGLTKAGAGTLKLTGAQVYTGPTAVNAGTLLIDASLSGSSAVTVNSTGSIGGLGSVGALTVNNSGAVTPGDPATASGVGTFTVNSLLMAAGSGMRLDFVNTTTDDQVTVLNSGGLTLSGGALTLLAAGTNNPFTTNGTYTLINFSGGFTGSTNNLSIANAQPGKSYSFTNSTTTAINLTIGDSVASSWTGAGDKQWGTGGNWVSNSIPNGQGVSATFGADLVGTDGTVNLGNGQNWVVGSMSFNNAVSFNLSTGTSTLTLDNGAASAIISVTNGTHTIGLPVTLNSNLQVNANTGTSLTIGAMTGATKTLTVGGTGGTVILTGNNSYTTTTLNAGTLQVGNGAGAGSLGSGTITLGNGTSLVFNRTGTLSVAGPITGGGATISQNGTGTVVVPALPSGVALAVNAGTLDLNGNGATLSSLTGVLGTAVITDNSATPGTSAISVVNTGAAANMDYNGALNKGATRDLSLSVNLTGANNKLTLHSASTYTGGTTVLNGLLDVLASNGLGTAGTINMNAQAAPTRLELGDGVTIPNPITLTAQNSGVGLGTLTTVTTSQTSTFSGPINVATPNNVGSGGHIVGPTAGGNLIFTGPITTSTGSQLLIRAGNVRFSDSTGTSNVVNIGITGPGVTSIGIDNGMSTSAVLNMGQNGTAGTLDLNGFNQTIAGMTQTTAGSAITNSVGDGVNNPGDNRNLTVNAGADSTYAGAINGNINLVKTGAGTLTLSNAVNAYNGTTTISNGVLVAGTLTAGLVADSIGFAGGARQLLFDGGTLRYAGANVSTDRPFDITAGKTATIDVSTAATTLTWTGGANATSGGFAKAGAGTLLLTAAHQYTGNTTVSAGTLVIDTSGSLASTGAMNVSTGGTLLMNGTASSVSSVSVASGGLLGGTGTLGGTFNHTAGTISGATVGTQGTLTLTGPLTMNGGTAVFDITNSSTGDLINANGGFTFGATPSNIDVEFSNVHSLPASFSYKLFNYTGGTFGGTANFTYTSNLGRASFTTVTSNPNEIDVNVVTGGGAANLNWNSTLDANWDTATSNWFNTGTSAVDTFHAGDDVNLVDNNANSSPPNGQLVTSINLASTVTPSSVNLTANTNNYTVAGAGKISGPATVSLTGTASLTLATNNDYTGATTISNGTLNIAGGGTVGSLGTGSVSIASAGTLLYSRSDSTTITNTVSGSGHYTIAGTTNITVLNGDNSAFTGTLTIQSGIVRPVHVSTFNSGATVMNGGEIYWDTGSNHAPAQNGTLTINGTGSGAAGANNDGALRVGSATTTTWLGVINVASNALIGLDGGSTLSLTNANPIVGTNTTLSLTGGGTLSIGGNLNLGASGALATGTSPVIFAAPANTTIAASSPISGGGAVTVNSSGTFAVGTQGTATFVDNPAFTGPITVGSGNLTISTANGLGTTAGATTIAGSGAVGTVTGSLLLNNASGMTIAENFTLGGHGATGETSTAILNLPHIDNVTGNNVLTGTMTMAAGGSNYNIQSDAGLLTIQSNISTTGLGSARTLQLQGAGNGAWSGVISDIAAAPLALNMNGTGTWTLSGADTYTGNTSVNSGTLKIDPAGSSTGSSNYTVAATATLNAYGPIKSTASVTANGSANFGTPNSATSSTQALTALTVGAGSTSSITLSLHAATPKTLQVTTLTFGDPGSPSTSTLNITNNILISSGLDTDAEALITTKKVVTSVSGLALGYRQLTTGPNTFEIRATLLGDSDLDGRVNVADLANLAGNFGKTSGQVWLAGDFDYNGNVNVADLADLAGNFGKDLTSAGFGSGGGAAAAASPAAVVASGAAAVPEPASIGLLGVGALALLPRRRRRRHD